MTQVSIANHSKCRTSNWVFTAAASGEAQEGAVFQLRQRKTSLLSEEVVCKVQKLNEGLWFKEPSR